MKQKIYITRKLPEDIIAPLTELFDVKVWEEEDIPVPYEVLKEEIQAADGLFCLLTDQIDEPLLESAKNLKIISTMAVGYNNIDIEAATKRGITVTHTPGVLTETTADLTFALLMATARRIVESSDFLRKGEWQTWSPFLLTGQDIYEKTIGIIGFGNIGQAVARRAKGFNMEILYYNRSRKEAAEKEIGATYVDLDTLLQRADYVCLLTPYTKETHHLIDKEELAIMKRSAILINTARGDVVNEEALYEALVNKQIWAAGLDVFAKEPVPLDNPLLSLPNVTTLPHIGSASISTRTRMIQLVCQQLIEGLTGKTPKHIVKSK